MAQDPSKTEQATPKRRQDERKKGHVPMSKDVVGVASLFAAIVSLRLLGSTVIPNISAYFVFCFEQMQSAQISEAFLTLAMRFLALTARVVGPVAGLAIFAATTATFAQTRFLVTTDPIKPKLSKLNPLKGLKNLFSVKSLIETLKNLLKISILLFLVYLCLRDMIEVATRFLYAEIGGACRYLFDAVYSMLLKIAAAFLVIAAVDFFYQKWDYNNQLKMTKQEVKEEYKQTEGDPKVKGKIKEIQRKMAMQRMMDAVSKADVVVRNPTHVAVALRYHPGEDEAPVVLAMGLDYLALRIVAVAEQNNVTVIENVPLARALYAEAELNQQIPSSLYEAVAEVMIYLFKLGKLKGEKRQPGSGA